MSETKHGGSPASGIVTPAGIEQHSSIPGSVLVMPEIARTKAQAKERALQFERRRIALVVLGNGSVFTMPEAATISAQDVAVALAYADELLKQTGGVI